MNDDEPRVELPEVSDESLRPFVRAVLATALEVLDRRARIYAELRELYRPSDVRILFVGESPPAAGDNEEPRFFYSPKLSAHDNLYRGIAEALYGTTRAFDVKEKAETLAKFKEDGYWLIDALDSPINLLSRGERRDALKAATPQLVKKCVALAPRDGVIICHGLVYKCAALSIREEGLRILHDSPLPFPARQWRPKFIEGVRDAVARTTRRPER